ncbi:MAG: hypothetical protein P8N57_07045 [Flavobacteriaceae bacterium]|nr:hypothetical protein [Flavobacteriaceae bacterium]
MLIIGFQIYQEYGLDILVTQRVFERFNIQFPINREKKINKVTLEELQAVRYLT